MTSVHRLLAAVRRRRRLSDIAWGLARIALPAGLWLAALALVAIARFDAPQGLLWVTALPVPLVLAWAALRRHPWRATVRAIDAHYGLDDTLGNALELHRTPPRDDNPRTTSIVALARARAEAQARTLDPRPVVPLSVPPPRWSDGLAAAAAVGAMFVPPPDPPVVFSDPDPILIEIDRQPQYERLDLALAEPLRENLRDLASAHQDTPAELAEAILDVLEALEKGEIDRAAALERLEQLEQELAAAEERWEADLKEDPATLAEAMRDLAGALEQQELTQEAARALERNDGDEAEQALDEAAAQAEAEAKAREQLDKALAEAERRLGKAADKKTDTDQKLDEAERRLRREQKKQPQTPQEQQEHERRLKRMK
ncbi:MAG: hypothetical protein AAGF11_31905, partial [Myxococcota bacterium]